MSGHDDQPFRHHTLKHRLVSWISRNMFGNLTYTVRSGPLEGMRRKGGLAWIPSFARMAKQSPEHRFLAGLDVSGKVVFDVGAFEGLITLFFARQARHVVCFEPNSRNAARLQQNLELNNIHNVTLRQFGLGEKPSSATMVWDPAMAGAATMADTSMACTINSRKSVRREEIRITSLDQDFVDANLPQPDLIKIDVEGYELLVLKGARRLLETIHPPLYLEVHGETMNDKRRNVRDIVTYLAEAGYRTILHVDSGEFITFENCERAAQGHLYATQHRARATVPANAQTGASV